jgi:hypothetical protein
MEVMKVTMVRHQHVQIGFNACMGILRLASAYSSERLENACVRALHFKTPIGSNIKAILDQHLDQEPINNNNCTTSNDISGHENVRGESYYQIEMDLTNA